MMNATEGWLTDLSRVVGQGLRVSPRGQSTLELVGFQSSPVDMSQPFLTSKPRKLGYRFMAAEAAWILSGDNRVETISPYSKEISNFSDDGKVFAGAYGPKVLDQIEYVVESLAKDRDTRQAVLTIWRENPGPSKDVPCTVSVQWLVRDGLLHCVDTMRSSDLWLGHPYDVVNFSMLSVMVAVELRDKFDVKVGLGSLFLQAGSKHVYERNLEGAKLCLDELVDFKSEFKRPDPGPTVSVDKFDCSEHLVEHLWTLADSGKILEQSSWDA
jgi:thymidylate synthase